jgi:hypothetical protein
MSEVYFPSYEALSDWFWIMLDDETYNAYLTRNQWVSYMELGDREIFYLLLWFSEGCPNIE